MSPDELTLPRPAVYPDLLEEHFDQLDFLEEHRAANVFTPDWTLADLAQHEARAEAHLDALRLAGAQAQEAALERLPLGGFASTAAGLVLLSAGAPGEARVLEALRADDPAVRDGLRHALRQDLPAGLREPLLALAAAAAPELAIPLQDVLAFHRRLTAAPFPHDAAAGLETVALGTLGRRRAFTERAALEAALAHPEPAVRRAALEAAARSGAPHLAAVCRAHAERPTDPDPEVLAFLGILGERADCDFLAQVLERPDLAPLALAALGASGRPFVLPTILARLDSPELAKHAAAAFARIAGGPDVTGTRPLPSAPEDVDATLSDDPPPDREAIERHWESIRSSLDDGARYQAGQPLPDHGWAPLFDSLVLGDRRDLFLGAAARGATLPDLELEERAVRQLARSRET